jgi:hypothetical protein
MKVQGSAILILSIDVMSQLHILATSLPEKQPPPPPHLLDSNLDRRMGEASSCHHTQQIVHLHNTPVKTSNLVIIIFVKLEVHPPCSLPNQTSKLAM